MGCDCHYLCAQGEYLFQRLSETKAEVFTMTKNQQYYEIEALCYMRKWGALCRSPIYDSSFTSSRSKLIQCLISTFYLKDNFYLERSKQETSKQLCVLPFKNLNILTYTIYFLSSNIQQPSCKKTFRCFNNFPLFSCPKHVYTKLSKSLKHSKMFQILLLNGCYRNSCSI